MMSLAKQLRNDYVLLGKILGLERRVMQEIKATNGNEVDCAFEMIKVWANSTKHSDSGTPYKILIDALSMIERDDVVKFVRLGEYVEAAILQQPYSS